MKWLALLAALASLTVSCSQAPAPGLPAASGYFDNTGRDDVLGGGVRMIPIATPKGEFHVWTAAGTVASLRVWARGWAPQTVALPATSGDPIEVVLGR